MLTSHDNLNFDVTPTGMTLQLLQAFEDVEPDTILLHGRDVALLLYRLTTPNADGAITFGDVGATKLYVKTEHNGPGPNQMKVILESEKNTVSLRSYERDMLVAAIKSRVWRLFT